jgi:uncharacterized protein YodC (DUF2158 family)
MPFNPAMFNRQMWKKAFSNKKSRAEDMSSILKIGDVVELKSGSVRMVVDYLPPYYYTQPWVSCTWLWNGEVRRCAFPIDTLLLKNEKGAD